MNSCYMTLQDTWIGYAKFRHICRKHGINTFLDYTLVLPSEQQRICQLMISYLDMFLEHEIEGKNKKVLLITDDVSNIFFPQEHSDRISAIHVTDARTIEQIITCCSMYMPSDKVFIGMLAPLQCRGSIEKLEILGIDEDEIIRNGIYSIDGIKTVKTRNYSSLFNLFQYVIASTYYLQGYRIYRRLIPQNAENEAKLFVYDYSGMGDVYVFSLYLKKFMEVNRDKDIYLVVKNDACRKVAKMSGILNTLVISEHQIKMLTYYARAARFTDNDISIITPFPKRVPTDIYSHNLYGNRINMAEVYRCVMFGLQDNIVDYPSMPRREDKIRAFFEDNGLRKGNTIIISPSANTIIGFPDYFWNDIAKRLIGVGFDVCTNVSGSENEIEGTRKVWFALEDAEHIVSDAGYFLGLRSGLCDVICNSTGFKCILYPNYELFNSSVYDYTSFERMGLGRNIYEIRWDFQRYDELAEIVASKFANARIK